MLREEGVKGFYKGLCANLIRGIPQKGIYFYVYEILKKVIIKEPKCCEVWWELKEMDILPTLSLILTFFAFFSDSWVDFNEYTVSQWNDRKKILILLFYSLCIYVFYTLWI